MKSSQEIRKTTENNKIIEIRDTRKEVYEFQEAIRTLRTNIKYSGKYMKVIMFTSSLPDEGKSLISFAYAQAQAQLGLKTLYIDTDIRKSCFQTRFNVRERVIGLSQYLTGQIDISEIIYETDIPNLSVIFSGPYSPNPVELLEDESFAALVGYASRMYDCVVIDTPPIGSVIDGAIVAQYCDGAVIVVESGAISRKLLQHVRDQLLLADCRILGVVMNKVKQEDTTYSKYGRYGKYGRYSRYGKYAKYGRYGQYERYVTDEKNQ